MCTEGLKVTCQSLIWMKCTVRLCFVSRCCFQRNVFITLFPSRSHQAFSNGIAPSVLMRVNSVDFYVQVFWLLKACFYTQGQIIFWWKISIKVLYV